MKIKLGMLCLLMSSFVGAMIQESINDDKALFAYCWDIYLAEYIRDNDIKLHKDDNKNGITQWQEKIQNFKKRLESVGLLYEEWSKGKKLVETLYDKTTTGPLATLRTGNTEIDYLLVGDCHWLLVALGLAKNYYYTSKDSEYSFLKKNEESFKKIGITIQGNDNGYKIESVIAFFDDHFIRKGIEIKELFPFITIENETFGIYYKKALKCGTLPNVITQDRPLKDVFDQEEKWVLNKSLKEITSLCNNFCILLIPGRIFLANQTPYTVLYGRLIQYALIHLLGFEYYENSIKLKANYLYRNSWIKDQKVPGNIKMQTIQFLFWKPSIYDDIDMLLKNKNIQTLFKNLERYANKDIVFDQDDKELLRDFKDQKDPNIRVVYKENDALLETLLKKAQQEEEKETQKMKEESERKRELEKYDLGIYVELYNSLKQQNANQLFAMLFDYIEQKTLFLNLVKKAKNQVLFLNILNKITSKDEFLKFYQNNTDLFTKTYDNVSDKDTFFASYNKAQNKVLFLEAYKEPFFKNMWNRGKKWIVSGLVVGAALSTWVFYNYFKKPALKLQPTG